MNNVFVKPVMYVLAMTALMAVSLAVSTLDAMAAEVYSGRPKPASGAYDWPAAEHAVQVERAQRIPMRDGVRLSTDLYFPEIARSDLPVIYIATPYNKLEGYPVETARLLAGQGFVVAIQDVRGKYESEGEFIVETHHGPDGYDTIDWLSTQPWSNGKVGTFGCSYLGQVQINTAKYHHPAHAAMITQAAGGMAGEPMPHGWYGPGSNGVPTSYAVNWLRRTQFKSFTRPPANLSPQEFVQLSDRSNNFAPEIPDVDYAQLFWHLPVSEMMDISESMPTDFQHYLGEDPGSVWWKSKDRPTERDTISTPAIHENSWADLGAQGTIYLWNLFQRIGETASARDNQFLVISPVGHCQSAGMVENQMVGDLNVGDPRLDYYKMYVDWFNYWLKGEKNGILDMPKVQVYTTGENQWQGGDNFPPPGTRQVEYYLDSQGGANTRYGDGVLQARPAGVAYADRFVYDPEYPVLSGPGQRPGVMGVEPNSRDEGLREARNDVLVYTSAPFPKGLEVTGPVSVVLYVSSDAKDTDFHVWLVDVDADGRAYNLQQDAMRARFREGFDRPVWMEKDEVYEIEINLALSHFFKPGHRVRIAVASSNFPFYFRNLNTGGDNFTESEPVIARNAVHHSATYRSRLVLPVKN